MQQQEKESGSDDSMTQEYPLPHKQTRDIFITLYNTRLFTAELVWDMCHRGQCVERERVAISMSDQINALESLEPDKYSPNWFEIQTLKTWRNRLRKGEP